MRVHHGNRPYLASASLLAVLLTAPAALAQVQEPPPPAVVLMSASAAAAQEPATRTLHLSLQDTVELALRHNLQVRIASRNPDLSEEQIRFQRSLFDPILTFNLPQAFTRSTQPTSSSLGGADVLVQEAVTTGFAVSAQTSWGLGWSLTGSGTRSVTNNEFSTFNPRYDTNVALNVRQPLLRNRGAEVNASRLRVARNDFSVSREQFRLQLQQSLFGVIQDYWGLVNAYRSLEVARSSLQLAQEQLNRNNAMVRIGVLAAVDVIQTEQQVADAGLTVIQAEIMLQNQQDQLKASLNLDAVVAEGWDVEIVPTDDPAARAEPIDVDAAVQEALRKSPAMRQDEINLQSRQVDLRAAGNQLLPQVDFVGSVQLTGLGGDQIFRSGAFGGNILEIQEGGLTDSFQQLLSGDFRNWSLGVQVSFPIRNDQARAQHAQASIRERQAADQRRDRELQIRLQVRNAARSVIGGTQQVAAAGNALRLAERQYTAELRRFETGTSSTFQVLSFQRQLTLARQRELLAVIGLNLALANFEVAKGTLLERFGVELDDAGTGGPMLPSQDPRPAEVGTEVETAGADAEPSRQ